MKANIQSSKLFSKVYFIIFALIFASIGTYLIINSFAVTTGTGTTYYVSSNGTGNGLDPTTPASFSSVSSKPVAGDTVVFKNGTYLQTIVITRGGSAADSLVTYKSESRWGAKIDGGYTRPNGFTVNAPFVKIEGFEITKNFNAGDSASGIELFGGNDSDAVIVGNHIHNIATGQTADTSNDNGQVGVYVDSERATIEGNYIHDIGRTNEVNLDHGIYLNSGDGHKVKNNILKNFSMGWGVQMYPGPLTNVKVENNTFIDGKSKNCANPNPCDEDKQGTLITTLSTSVSNSTISNNIFYDSRDNNSGAIDVGGTKWSGNTVNNNVINGPGLYWNSAKDYNITNIIPLPPSGGTISTQTGNQTGITALSTYFVDPNANTPEGYAIKATAPEAIKVAGAVGYSTYNGGSNPPVATASCDPAFTYKRPYTDDSPWNTPLVNPTYSPNNADHINALKTAKDSGAGPLSSDPTQYNFPVYYVNNSTPKRTIKFTTWFADAQSDTLVNNYRLSSSTFPPEGGGYVISPTDTAISPPTNLKQSSHEGVPIPNNVAASPGSDAQLIIINTDTGEQWAFTYFARDTKGTSNSSDDIFTTGSLTRYNINFNGVPAISTSPWPQIGAGVSALAGIIRPCEIQQGKIDHALAFAYAYPARTFAAVCNPDTARVEPEQFVYPARKSDGSSCYPDILEGTRLQLDPTISDSTIRSWTYTDAQNRTFTCNDACFIIAKALQKYGMYTVDQSGNPKLRAEGSESANWSSMPANLQITANTPNPIPWTAFKVVEVGCSNGRDDDGDGKIDTADSGCTSANDFEELSSSTPTPTLPGDVDGNKVVDIDDLSLLLINWKKNYPQADFVKDNIIDIDDLSILLVNWGKKLEV